MVYSYLRYSNLLCAWRRALAAGLLAGSVARLLIGLLAGLPLIGGGCDRNSAAEVAEAAEAEKLDPAVDLAAEAAIDIAAEVPVADAAAPDAIPDKILGEFQLTYYWMASERKGASERDVQLYTKKCKPLVKVSKSFAARLAREGTGKLLDGRTINVSGDCACDHKPCFFAVGRGRRWGVGVYERPLSPFRSVAVDPAEVSIGTLLYIPELDGLTMPGRKPWGGFVHDGCVVADDTGGNVTGNQIDLFVAQKPHYYSFYRRYRMKRVTVLDGQGRCEHDDDNKVVRVNRNST